MNKIIDFAFAEVPFIFTKHEVLSKDNTNCHCRGAVYLHEDVVRVKVIKEALSYSGFAFMILFPSVISTCLTLGKESKLSLHSLTRKNHEDAVRIINNFTKFVPLIKIKYL